MITVSSNKLNEASSDKTLYNPPFPQSVNSPETSSRLLNLFYNVIYNLPPTPIFFLFDDWNVGLLFRTFTRRVCKLLGCEEGLNSVNRTVRAVIWPSFTICLIILLVWCCRAAEMWASRSVHCVAQHRAALLLRLLRLLLSRSTRAGIPISVSQTLLSSQKVEDGEPELTDGHRHSSAWWYRRAFSTPLLLPDFTHFLLLSVEVFHVHVFTERHLHSGINRIRRRGE